MVLVVALSVLGSWLAFSRPATSTPVGVAATASASASTPAVDLDAVLGEALGGVDGHFAVAVADPAAGTGASYGEDAFVTASIVKVDILAALLWKSGGELTDVQRSSAALMIEQSDNDAATALLEAAGGASGLDEANAAFGLTATVAGTDGYWGLTSTTAADQLRLLSVVFTEESPLEAESRAYLRQLMGRVVDGQDWGVSAADQGGSAQLKNGWLPRTATGLWVVNSIGRIAYGGRELLVAVVSDGSTTQQDGIALVESVAKAAVGAFASTHG